MRKMFSKAKTFILWPKVMISLLLFCIIGTLASSNAKHVLTPQLSAFTPTPPPTAVSPLPETVPLQRMELAQSITTMGAIQSHSTQDVYSTLSYKISSVHVQVGDVVTAGQVLCQLDTTALDLDIAETQLTVERAQESDTLKLSQAQRKLTVAEEQLVYDTQRLIKAVDASWQELEAARIVDANQAADTLVSPAAYEKAESDMLQAEQDLLMIPTMDPFDPTLPNEAYRLQKEAYDNALMVYNIVFSAYFEERENVYQSTLDSGIPSPETENHRKAKENQETILRENTLNIENARDYVNTCQLIDSAASARAKLIKLTFEREATAITAPLSGTITAVGAKNGQVPTGKSDASTTSLFTIQDGSALSVQAQVSELDASFLRVNMPVNITSNALSDQQWNGTLAAISPIASDDAGTFTITVKLTSKPGAFTLGMRATVTIPLEGERQGFVVPPAAVVRNEQGNTVVFELMAESAAAGAASASLASGGSLLREIPVTAGTPTDTYTEISGDGLQEGMPLVANPAAHDRP